MSYPRAAVDHAFSLLPPTWDTLAARRQHCAIGHQETGYLSRRQLVSVEGRLRPQGPAVSFWQFEKGPLAGINGVLTHRATAPYAAFVCRERDVSADRMSVWQMMQTDDVLGAAFARLLMYSDPQAVPVTQASGWAMYLRTWRPGKPHPDRWPAAWQFALGQYP